MKSHLEFQIIIGLILLGIAFTLKKKIVIVKNEPLTESKSFQRMLVEWRKSA